MRSGIAARSTKSPTCRPSTRCNSGAIPPRLPFGPTTRSFPRKPERSLSALGYGQTFQISRANTDLADRSGSATNEVFRIVSGLRGNTSLAGRDYSFDLSINYGRSSFIDRAEAIDRQKFVNAVNVAMVNGLAACSVTPTVSGFAAGVAPVADPTCVPLNLFGDGAPSDAALGLRHCRDPRTFASRAIRRYSQPRWLAGQSARQPGLGQPRHRASRGTRAFHSRRLPRGRARPVGSDPARLGKLCDRGNLRRDRRSLDPARKRRFFQQTARLCAGAPCR